MRTEELDLSDCAGTDSNWMDEVLDPDPTRSTLSESSYLVDVGGMYECGNLRLAKLEYLVGGRGHAFPFLSFCI